MAGETTYILGAGFSKNAGIPLQSEFTDFVRRARGFGTAKPSRIIVEQADKFVSDVFHTGKDGKWPEWEDIFTFLDLSANSGHHLGLSNDPSRLRTLRRAFLARIIRMLDQAYGRVINSKDTREKEALRNLDTFLTGLDPASATVVSLNWDDVLERRLSNLRPDLGFNYGAHVRPALFAKGSQCDLVAKDNRPATSIKIAKMHGAVNWLYCDACRRQLSFPPDTSTRVAGQLMGKRDWDQLGVTSGIPVVHAHACPFCDTVLGTRIATFSYRKVLDSPTLLKTWFFAEDLLRVAKNWVFVGYSLPEADYEFKYLLKRVELSRRHPPHLFVIDKSTETAQRFRKFFGTRLPNEHVCLDGLGPKAVRMLENGKGSSRSTT